LNSAITSSIFIPVCKRKTARYQRAVCGRFSLFFSLSSKSFTQGGYSSSWRNTLLPNASSFGSCALSTSAAFFSSGGTAVTSWGSVSSMRSRAASSTTRINWFLSSETIPFESRLFTIL